MPEDEDKDENTEAKAAVDDVTGEKGKVDAEELIGDEDVKRQLRDAKKRLRSGDS